MDSGGVPCGSGRSVLVVGGGGEEGMVMVSGLGLGSAMGMVSGEDEEIEMGLFRLPFLGRGRGEDEKMQIGWPGVFDMIKNRWDGNVNSASCHIALHMRVVSEVTC